MLTRDLGVAAFLLRMPRGCRPPLVYESHGYAPEVAAALPSLVATATPPSAGKLRRLAAREAPSGAAPTATSRSRAAWPRSSSDALRRARRASRWSPTACASTRLLTAPATSGARPARRPVVAYAGHLYAWKGVDVLLEALASCRRPTG